MDKGDKRMYDWGKKSTACSYTLPEGDAPYTSQGVSCKQHGSPLRDTQYPASISELDG